MLAHSWPWIPFLAIVAALLSSAALDFDGPTWTLPHCCSLHVGGTGFDFSSASADCTTGAAAWTALAISCGLSFRGISAGLSSRGISAGLSSRGAHGGR